MLSSRTHSQSAGPLVQLFSIDALLEKTVFEKFDFFSRSDRLRRCT